jgi:conjugal transfer pilus assembly protein TraI
MAPGTSSGTVAQPFASSDPGFETLPLAAVIEGHRELLGRIKLCFGADRATFECELMPLVHGYARFVHLLPATADNYFHTPGGLLQLGLETAFFSLQGTDAHIFSGRATISERRELEPRWRIATFIGGLCCELHRTLTHLIVTTADGEEWPAFLGGLAPWLEQQAANRYFVRWRANARETRGAGLFALTHVVPAEVLQMLGHGNSLVVPQLLACIAGVPQYREHNVLDELVRRSMALVIDRNLLASADRYGKPQYGSHLERYLVDALRRLAAGHSAWTPNRDKSRVWLGPEGLFLVWPGAAEDALALLESDQLVGIPKSPHTLLDLLLGAEVLVTAVGRHTWDIQPPGAKTAIEAVKLANPAILLAGLDPQPSALTANLIAAPAAQTKPPAQAANAKTAVAGDSPTATATVSPPPTTLPPEMAAVATPTEQLSLLDATGNTDAGTAGAQEAASEIEAPASLPSAGEPSAIRLRAPMRLNPAVRKALTDIVATLSGDLSASDTCTVPEGIFVPLAEFERRGVQPGTAIRALDDARMIRRPQSSGPPTVSREIHDATVVGVILAPAHVEGLDPAAFGLAARGEAVAPSAPTATQHKGH